MIDIVYYVEDPVARHVIPLINDSGYKVYPVDNRIPLLTDPNKIPGDPRRVKVVVNIHRSAKNVRALTVHHLGNWTNKHDLGGESRSLSLSAPLILSAIGLKIKDLLSRSTIKDKFQFSIEATHHGPTFNIPIVFVEVGSSPSEWTNEAAVNILAEAIRSFEVDESKPRVLGVGGPHYAPNFTKFIEEYNFGHIIPKYVVDELDYETFVKGIEMSREKIDSVLIDWKGLKGPQRKKIVDFCNAYGIGYAKYP